MFLSTVDFKGVHHVARVYPDKGTVSTYGNIERDGRRWGMLDLIRQPKQYPPEQIGGMDGIQLTDVKLLAPIPDPKRNILCVGKNYRSHAEEFGNSGFDSSADPSAANVPDVPIFFTKSSNTIIGDGDSILVPNSVSRQVDYEAELAVIIGRGGRGIRRADAYKHVFGYTIINDVTARDLQARHKQWFVGKSIDTFCPMGPWVVTADAVDVENLQIRCWVNEELRQNANTRDLLFDIPTLIETISAGMTLEPGDIIATGTPEGVGIGFSPPKFLADGDEVVIEIEGIGRLSNRFCCVDDDQAAAV